jgi:hypothetical protein
MNIRTERDAIERQITTREQLLKSFSQSVAQIVSGSLTIAAGDQEAIKGLMHAMMECYKRTLDLMQSQHSSASKVISDNVDLFRSIATADSGRTSFRG